MAIINFDATNVSTEFAIQAVPAGWYNVMIDESEMKPTKDGANFYLKLRLSILDGEYAGQKIFDNLNLKNANPVAQEIAYKKLSAYAHACGVLHVQDSQQLHNIPFKVNITLKKDPSGQYADQNNVTGIKRMDAARPQAAAQPVIPPPAAPQTQFPNSQPAATATAPVGSITNPASSAPFNPNTAPAQPWDAPAQPSTAPAEPAQGELPPWLQ